MSDAQGPMGQFKFGLEPVIEFMTRLPATFEIKCKGAGTDFILRRTIDLHESPRHQRR